MTDENTTVLSIGYPSKGQKFTIEARYAEGDTLSSNEAKALNGLLVENIRNNFSKKLESLQEANASQAEIDSAFAEYAEKYTFAATGVRGPRQPSDPVAKEANKIASEIIVSALRSKGKTKKDLAEGLFDKLVSQLLEQKPEITAEAKKRVEASKAMGADVLEGLI